MEKKGGKETVEEGKAGRWEGQVLTPLPRHRVSGTSFVQRAFRLPRNIQPGDRTSLIFAQTFLPGRDRDKILDGCAPFRLSDYTVSTRIRRYVAFKKLLYRETCKTYVLRQDFVSLCSRLK